MFLLEFNEFSYALTRRVADDAGLANLQSVLNWRRSLTSTVDRTESGFLEPWAQWVSVHTGEPCSRHGIKHLGDVPDLASKQIWETLSDRGLTSGAWGVMNASRRGAEKCLFFLPDPWTFTEPAYPGELTPLLELPRYLARNYLDVSKHHTIKLFGGFLSAAIRAVGLRDLLASLSILADGFAQFGPRHLVFIAWFEYVSSLACLRYYRRHKPDFCALFVNTIAHAQHHYWRDPETGSREVRFALTVFDKLLGKLLAAVDPDQPILVTNALSQTNTNEERAWILYRQKDPDAFVRAAGLDPIGVEPLMTHDAHLAFRTAEEARHAFTVLTEARVGTEPAFYVEANAHDQTRLFYRLEFTDELTTEADLDINGRKLNFLEWFALVVKRTGRHIPSGIVLARGMLLPDRLANHELCGQIIDALAPQAANAPSPADKNVASSAAR